jgi:hypothetical protein
MHIYGKKSVVMGDFCSKLNPVPSMHKDGQKKYN